MAIEQAWPETDATPRQSWSPTTHPSAPGWSRGRGQSQSRRSSKMTARQMKMTGKWYGTVDGEGGWAVWREVARPS